MLDNFTSSEKLLQSPSGQKGNINLSSNLNSSANAIKSSMETAHLNTSVDSSMLGREDRLLFTWSDLKLSVPLGAGDKQMLKKKAQGGLQSNKVDSSDRVALLAQASQQAAEGMITIDPQNAKNKIILTDSSGYAAPGQMLSIMGASGSGKTSLLSILAQRTQANRNCKVSGSLNVNGQLLGPRTFGKFGAFVMQDDILVETMTPYESFVFAAKIRTNLDDEQIMLKVETIISRLNLHSCRDTRIGGFTLKSISGGERKRTSIGYELITDPKILLLDEPTSGLDSTTALRIIKLLRKEVNQGMTVVATIHQPSGDIFEQFDRLLLLHNGQQLYQGPVNSVKDYLSGMNLEFNKFGNPADFVIKMAQAPMVCREDLTFEELVGIYQSSMKPIVFNESKKKNDTYAGISTNFEALGAEREVSMWKQFSMIFVRNWHYLLRNPRTLSGIAFNGVFTGLLQLALYWQIGNPANSQVEDSESMRRYIYNLNGLAFLLANNYQFGPVSSVTLQIPMQVPVFKREIMNRMYGPSVYLWARYLSNAILFMCYPISLTLVLFWGLAIENTFANFMLFLGYSLIMNALGMGLGYFGGTCSENDQTAQSISTFFILFWMLLSGGLGNLNGFPTFVQWLSYLSPQRYMCEGIFRCLIANQPPLAQEIYLQQLGYTLGNAVCLSILAGLTVMWIMLAWFNIWYKNRNV